MRTIGTRADKNIREGVEAGTKRIADLRDAQKDVPEDARVPADEMYCMVMRAEGFRVDTPADRDKTTAAGRAAVESTRRYGSVLEVARAVYRFGRASAYKAGFMVGAGYATYADATRSRPVVHTAEVRIVLAGGFASNAEALDCAAQVARQIKDLYPLAIIKTSAHETTIEPR